MEFLSCSKVLLTKPKMKNLLLFLFLTTDMYIFYIFISFPARSPVTRRREIRQLCENFAACEKSDILHEIIGPVRNLPPQQTLPNVISVQDSPFKQELGFARDICKAQTPDEDKVRYREGFKCKEFRQGFPRNSRGTNSARIFPFRTFVGNAIKLHRIPWNIKYEISCNSAE
jgi:hypothetical protein